jgi:hypothetical protein
MLIVLVALVSLADQILAFLPDVAEAPCPCPDFSNRVRP